MTQEPDREGSALKGSHVQGAGVDATGASGASGRADGTESDCRCEARTTRGVPLARGGTRFNRCKRAATTTREYVQRSLAWESTREVHLCGTHAAMFDRGMHGIMESQSR